MRDVWSSVKETSGAQFAMTIGIMLMPLLSVDSWDMSTAVSSDSYYLSKTYDPCTCSWLGLRHGTVWLWQWTNLPGPGCLHWQ